MLLKDLLEFTHQFQEIFFGEFGDLGNSFIRTKDSGQSKICNSIVKSTTTNLDI